MKAIVIGANGQLGNDLTEELSGRGWNVTGLTHGDIAVEDPAAVFKAIQAVRPDVVFNTAAFHVVPKCEEEPLRAFQVNALGALNVTRACAEVGTRVVYYSTDYVFDGEKRAPYTEDDGPNPLNIYAGTKLLGERFTLNYGKDNLVLRVCGLYGKVPCRAKGANFVTTMLKAAREKREVRVVKDETLSPTSAREAARKSLDLLDAGGTGLFHLVSEGHCSWYEFARVIFDTLGLTTPLVPVPASEFPSSVRRPSYSALDNRRLRTTGLSPMPEWRDSIVRFLHEHAGEL